MKYELGDHAYVKCPETGLVADLEFKTKGYFSGTYNAIGGYIRDSSGKNLFELSGVWNEEMYIKDLTVRYVLTGSKDWLTSRRLARRSFYSTQRTPSIPHHRLDPWRNKGTESRKDSGTMCVKLLSARTKMSQPTPRLRLKTAREKKRQSGTTTASTGTHNYSGVFTAVLAEVKKVKRILTGSLTLKCQCVTSKRVNCADRI
jgi:hypothetical protein